jgi:hypothetical protein
MSLNDPAHLIDRQYGAPDEVAPPRWKCCRCKKFCTRVDDAQWSALQVSKCCGQIAYRVEAEL